MADDSAKLIEEEGQWHLVAKELEDENLKLASYDNTLLPLLGDLKGKKVLDYGAGPGVLALAIKRLGGDIVVYDINPDMLKSAGEKIGSENIFHSIGEIPQNTFDIVICNLVVCIVSEDEVKEIVHNITAALNTDGTAYIGFCNPKIFNIPESNLDLRFQTGDGYEVNHRYKKVKKEGGYEIIEDHRPIEWYEGVYKDAGLTLVDKYFTPEYELKGNKVQDFIIFKLKKA